VIRRRGDAEGQSECVDVDEAEALEMGQEERGTRGEGIGTIHRLPSARPPVIHTMILDPPPRLTGLLRKLLCLQSPAGRQRLGEPIKTIERIRSALCATCIGKASATVVWHRASTDGDTRKFKGKFMHMERPLCVIRGQNLRERLGRREIDWKGK
jgi:hypothetical protein